MSRIRTMADRLNATRCRRDVWSTAMTFLHELELSKVIFMDLSSPCAPVILSNADESWTEDYVRSVKSGVDPFPKVCLSRVDPLLTGVDHINLHNRLDAAGQEHVARECDALRIRTGLSLTIKPDEFGAGVGWNLLTTLPPAQFAELRDEKEADWHAWCQLTYAALSRSKAPQRKVTPRERDCLALVADGCRMNDIADRLGIAQTTVEMHLRNARGKLGARTRDQAVAIAVSQGIV